MRLIMILIVAVLFPAAGAFASGLTFSEDSNNFSVPKVNVGIGTFTSRVKLEVDGIIYGTNIGVGTTSPGQKLEINNTAAFSSEYDNGKSGTSKTIDWNNGNKQRITLTGNCTLTFTAPACAALGFN